MRNSYIGLDMGGKRKHKKLLENEFIVTNPGVRVAPAPAVLPPIPETTAVTATASASDTDPRKHKDKIPKAVREQLWVRDVGEKFYGRCRTSWCANRVSVFDFQCGHNIPESKGGPTTLDNMVVLCSRCNNSMSNNYTFDEWQIKFQPVKLGWRRYFCGF